MNRQIKKYLYSGYLSLKKEWVFSFNFVMTLLTLAIQAVIYLLMLGRIFPAGSDLSAVELTAYYVIVNFVSITISPAMYVAYDHMVAINSGDIILDFVKPASCVIKHYVTTFFPALLKLLLNLLVVLVMQIYVLDQFDLRAIGLGVFSTLLAFSILYFWQGIVGCMAIYVHDVTRIRDVINSLGMVLGGKLLPSALLWGNLKNIVYWTPFPYIYDVPTSFFLGHMSYSSLTYQALWVLFLGSLYHVLFTFFVQRNIEYGG